MGCCRHELLGSEKRGEDLTVVIVTWGEGKGGFDTTFAGLREGKARVGEKRSLSERTREKGEEKTFSSYLP